MVTDSSLVRGPIIPLLLSGLSIPLASSSSCPYQPTSYTSFPLCSHSSTSTSSSAAFILWLLKLVSLPRFLFRSLCFPVTCLPCYLCCMDFGIRGNKYKKNRFFAVSAHNSPWLPGEKNPPEGHISAALVWSVLSADTICVGFNY